MRQFITKVGMSIMLMVFMVASVPPEHIHDLFVHHKDGIDPILKKGEYVMMEKHHHCSFLSFEFTPFITAQADFLVFEHISYEYSWEVPVYSYHFYSEHAVVSLRGPPAILA